MTKAAWEMVLARRRSRRSNLETWRSSACWTGRFRSGLRRCLATTVVVLWCVNLVSATSSHAIVQPNLTNVIGNFSFEFPVGTDLGGGVTNWDNTSGRGIITRDSAFAIDGRRILVLDESVTAAGEGSYTFQTVSGVKENDYVSFSVYAEVANADAGTDEAQVKLEFRDANDTLLSQATENTTSGAFVEVVINGTAPAGTAKAVFVLALIDGNGSGNAGSGVMWFDKAIGTISNYPIVVDASASKPQISKGTATFVSAKLKNVSEESMSNLELVATVPEGFNFIDRASRLDGHEINSREGSRVFSLGDIGSGDNRQLGFLLIASQAVQVGKRYEVSFFVRQTDGTVRSQVVRLNLLIVADPLFELGTILGKVFDDQNENAIQDEGEKGIPGVKLATEEGILVTTDQHGRYHIPGVKTGRHVVKIDGHTVPPNSKFISEEALLVKTTEGIMNVANFAVRLPESKIPEEYRKTLDVIVTQGTDFDKPHLGIAMEPNILRMGIGYFEKDPVFQISTNYGDLIAGWRIEIRDEFGDEVWTGYGLGAPPKEAPWTGKTKNREPIKSGVYSYRLIVRDKENREDWTPLQFFRVLSKLDKNAPDNPTIDVPAIGAMNVQKDGKRSIPTSAKPTVSVRGSTLPWNTVTINGENATVHLDGTFEHEITVPPGTQSVMVTTTDREGNSVSYQEEVKVKDSYFFMVALGEQELGVNRTKGNLEAVGRDEQYHQGFYQEGRAAYYLKAKIKGKFLVSSRYDTDDPRTAFFTNLDPDHYYPVYGDDSELQYDAYDTMQRFYVLVEMDKSYLKWGSFNSNFTDTELSTHNRTFSGFKLHHETLSTTKYGDSKRGVTIFTANTEKLADHNEFIGTGGSLFYLRNRNVVMGSEKIRVETRDKIQNMTVISQELMNGTDYEIDYPAGRIILRTPLSSVAYSDTIISNDILNGSNVYLIVDYEFEPQGGSEERNSGLRAFTHVGEHLRIGGTAIEDKRPDGDYDLRGVDLTAKFGNNTKITAEYAQSERRTIRNAISYNGGITFDDMATGSKVIKKTTRQFDDAFSIKAQTKFRTGTEVSGYAQKIEPGFSNADLITQAGTEKEGFEIRQKVGDYVQLSYRLDHQEATDPENKAGIFVTSPRDALVNTAQIKADYNEYLGIVEYRNQNVGIYGPDERSHTLAIDDTQFRNAVAGKLGYRLSDSLMPYAKAQVTWKNDSKGGQNHQFGGGVETKILNGKGKAWLEEMVGEIGDSTILGLDVQTSDTTNVYSTIKTGPDAEGSGRGFTTTIGSSSQVNSHSRFYSEREFSGFRTGERSGSIIGYDTKLTDRLGVDASFERSRIQGISDVDTNRSAGALELSWRDREFLKIISRYELRYDAGGPENRLHFLFRDTVDWKINDDYRFSARFNTSDTDDVTTEHTDGYFTEFNMGLAYRPVRHNRLNVLTRYTWLEDVGADAQFDTPDIFGLPVKETAHIFGVEFGYDLMPKWLSLVEKGAYRISSLGARGDSRNYMENLLWVNRLNFHVIRKWDLAIEYRFLMDFDLLNSMKHGVLVEIDREIMEYMRLGIGYNFTDFDDDLRKLNDINRNGFFTRLSGKF